MLIVLARRVLIPAAVSTSVICQTPSVIKWVAPDYPPLARYFNCSGHIEVSLTVKPDGTVESARAWAYAVENGQSHLQRLFPASEDAAKKWLFSPTKSTHHLKLNFAFQLYPPDTPDGRLSAEQITEHSILIKTKALAVVPRETQ